MTKGTNFTKPTPALRAVPMTLFPTMESLEDVVEMAMSKTPVVSKNEMQTVLMTYHNTLLSVINQTNQGS